MFSEEEKALINELGLQSAPEDQQALYLQKFGLTLKKKIGMALESELSEDQLAEFEKISEAGDDAATSAWLRQAIPSYDQVVAEETEDLKKFIKQSSDNFRDVLSEGS